MVAATWAAAGAAEVEDCSCGGGGGGGVASVGVAVVGASGAGATAEAGDVPWYRHGKTRPHTPPLVSVRAHLRACGGHVGPSWPPPRRPPQWRGSGGPPASFSRVRSSVPPPSVGGWMCASVATASVPSPRHVAAAGDVLKRPHTYAANRICARGQRNPRSAEVTRVAQGARDGVLGPAFLALRGLVARSRRVDRHARSRCVGVALGDVLAPVV